MSGGGGCLCFLQTLPRDRNRGESMSVWNNDTTLVAQYWLRYSTTFEKIVNNTTMKQIRITKWKRVAQSKFQTSETINGGILIRTFLFSARICNIRSSCQRTTHNTTFATPTACVVVWKRRRGAECPPPSLSSRANSGSHDYEFPWLSTDRFLKLLIHWEYANKRILTAFILPMTDPVFSSPLHREAKGEEGCRLQLLLLILKAAAAGWHLNIWLTFTLLPNMPVSEAFQVHREFHL